MNGSNEKCISNTFNFNMATSRHEIRDKYIHANQERLAARDAARPRFLEFVEKYWASLEDPDTKSPPLPVIAIDGLQLDDTPLDVANEYDRVFIEYFLHCLFLRRSMLVRKDWMTKGPLDMMCKVMKTCNGSMLECIKFVSHPILFTSADNAVILKQHKEEGPLVESHVNQFQILAQWFRRMATNALQYVGWIVREQAEIWDKCIVTPCEIEQSKLFTSLIRWKPCRPLTE